MLNDREMSEFDSGQTQNADLVWIPAQGGDGTLILPARGAGSPHFTHDKDRIYIYTPQGLVSLRFDGTDRRTHLVVKGKGLYFAEEPVPAENVKASPDGQWVLAQVMNQLYVIGMPVVGGEAPTVDVATHVRAREAADGHREQTTLHWADDGKTITWAVGATVVSGQPLGATAFEPPKEEEKKDGDKKDTGAQTADANKDEKKEEKKEPKKLKRRGARMFRRSQSI